MTTSIPSATDFSQLRALGVPKDEVTPEVLMEVSKQFEALFTQEMLKSMRKANASFESSMMQSNANDMYQEMHDEQMALTLSSQGNGIGLADVIYRQLSGLNSIKRTDQPHMTTSNTDKLDVSSPESFVKSVYPNIKEFAQSKGFDPKILLAQTVLETGWGKSLDQGQSELTNNLFGVKTKSDWQGQNYSKETVEYIQGQKQTIKADFRRYESATESLEDYWQFLQQPHYQEAVGARQDAKQYFAALQQAGYATDPQYAQKLERVYDSKPLSHYVNTLEG